MKLMFLLVFSFALILSLILSLTTSEKAQWLVRYQKTDEQFQLNEDALSKLSHLPKPVKVISAIGEARLGKSTTLNFVHHTLDCDGGNEAEIEEVFRTGDSMEPVTFGIWMSVCEKESIVLLDVEGTNLGSDAITSHMSVFTSLMSSGIVIFSAETIKNDILDFLYEVTRLSEHIFKDIDNNNNFGHLHIVIRDPLRHLPGKTFEDEVRDMIVKPSGVNKAIDKQRRAIAKYFYKNNIKVSKISKIGNRQLLKDIQIKNNVEFWNTIQLLSQSFKNFPNKTTLRSNFVNGKALVQIARILITTMNENSWLDFGENYLMVEKYLCDKNFQVTVAPILSIETADEIEQKKESVLKAFKGGCGLIEEVNKVEEQLRTLINDRREKEKKVRQLQAAEEAKKKLEMEREAAVRSVNEIKETVKQIKQEMEKHKSEKEEKAKQLQAAEEAKRKLEMEGQAAERSIKEMKKIVRKIKEEMENERRENKKKARQLQAAEDAERRAEIEREAAEKSRIEMEETARKAKQQMENLKQNSDSDDGDDFKGVISGVLAGALALLSDERLKANVITVNPSKYEALGVREVTWTWNEQAAKIGLRGEARGVIAQEVEELYPWAVVTGSEGYKRVLYGALDYALDSMNKAKRKEDKPD